MTVSPRNRRRDNHNRGSFGDGGEGHKPAPSTPRLIAEQDDPTAIEPTTFVAGPELFHPDELEAIRLLRNWEPEWFQITGQLIA